MCRDEVRKARAHLQVNMSRDMKNNKKRFYIWLKKTKGKCRYIIKSKELKTKDVEITKVL